MHNGEWKEILDGVIFQGLSHENVIDRIKVRLLAAGHQDIYRKWEGNNFSVNHSFAFQSEHTNGECTLLHLAASYGLIDVVKALLKTYANAKAKDQDDATPLHWTAINGNADVVEVLLKNGAHVNAVDQDRESPLHWAVKFNNKDITRILLKKGADPTLKNENGKTSINLAQDNNTKQLLKRAKARQFFTPTTLSMTAGLIVLLEVVIAVQHILAQKNTHTIMTPITVATAVISIALVTVGGVLAYQTFVSDTDEPSTRVNVAQTRESYGIEVSVV